LASCLLRHGCKVTFAWWIGSFISLEMTLSLPLSPPNRQQPIQQWYERFQRLEYEKSWTSSHVSDA
jgi:hypothetical protein